MKNCFIVSVFLFVIFVLISGCGLIAIISGSLGSMTTSEAIETQVYGSGTSKVALIKVKGEITGDESSGGFFDSISDASTGNLIPQIQKAIDDSSVKGILIEMDTPGGEIVATDLIYQKLLEAKNAGKKVITYMYTYGASGGYYIASLSDLIYANELTTTGSIGVYMQMQDISGLYEKLGIKQRTIKVGDYKTGDGLFDEDDNGEEDKIYQTIIDECYARFTKVISLGRDMEIAEVEKLADGRIYSGKQALENGLIDRIGGFQEAYDAMKDLTGESQLSVVEYSSTNFFGEVFSSVKWLNSNYSLLSIANIYGSSKLMYKLQ